MKRLLTVLPMILAASSLTFLPPILYHLFVHLWGFLAQIGGAA